MLVITYNSEHNHPWPTQRNALAGSTRSHLAKNNNNNSSSSSYKQNNSLQKPLVKAEPEQTTAATAKTTTTSTSTPSATSVKEEETVASEMAKGMQQHAINQYTFAPLDPPCDLMQQMFNQSYRPMIPEGGHHDDFFADLAELESDPMSLIFSKEYTETKTGGEPGNMEMVPKGLADPLFNMLDWGATTTAVATSPGSSSLEQGEGAL
jgi:hypothetical protein